MGKEFIDGTWVLTRDKITPDSARHIEKDDIFFNALNPIFKGEVKQIEFEPIAAAYQSKPEEVFIDLHENYSYICIGTGENPAIGEKLSPEEKEARKQSIKKALEAYGIPYTLIKGKYMGVEEDSFFIPYMDRSIGLPAMLKTDMIAKLKRIATEHNQDSLLICKNGHACYLYTSGEQEGKVITGRTAVVYPGKATLPDDCYSLFLNPAGDGTVGFTCGLNFSRVYNSVDEFAAEENRSLQQHYESYAREWPGFPAPYQPSSTPPKDQKTVILMRGTDGYNDYGKNLKAELEKKGLRVAIFGSDGNIAKIEEELKDENSEISKRAKLYKEKLAAENAKLLATGEKAKDENIWGDIIRPEFLRRNAEIYKSLLDRDDIDVIIYADMNKLTQFMEPYVSPAKERGYDVVTHVVNSFVFQQGRSDYVGLLQQKYKDYEKVLRQKYGDFMGRHVLDFKRPESQITADELTFGETTVGQHHDIACKSFASLVLEMRRMRKAIAALTSKQAGSMFAASPVVSWSPMPAPSAMM